MRLFRVPLALGCDVENIETPRRLVQNPMQTTKIRAWEIFSRASSDRIPYCYNTIVVVTEAVVSVVQLVP